MIRLWHRMAEFFGPQWEASYGAVDGGAIYSWQGALNRYSEAELAGAVKSCENWDGKFPPTFPEFKALVMAARSAQKPTVTDNRLALEKAGEVPLIEHLAQYAHSEVAKRELERMYRILAGEEVETFDQSYHNLSLGRRWPGARTA